MAHFTQPSHTAASLPGMSHADPEAMPENGRSLTTRVLHGLILLAVLHQLIGSYFLTRQLPGEAPDTSFLLHEYIGIASMAVVTLFWIWTLVRRRETSFTRLIPWFSIRAIGAVLADGRAQLVLLLRGRAPDDADGPLASATHGLGLLTLTAMALTGTIYFFIVGTPSARPVLIAHKLMANLMWAYLIAHAGLAVLHQLLGTDMVSRMFWRRSPPTR